MVCCVHVMLHRALWFGHSIYIRSTYFDIPLLNRQAATVRCSWSAWLRFASCGMADAASVGSQFCQFFRLTFYCRVNGVVIVTLAGALNVQLYRAPGGSWLLGQQRDIFVYL